MTGHRATRRFGVLAVAALLGLGGLANAEVLARRVVFNGPRGAVGPDGTINLPYMVSDNNGNQWRIYQNGWLQQQGNTPLYSQGAMLMVNGQQLQNNNNNQARLDQKTGEVVFENMNAGNGFTITRRVLIDRDAGMVRYVDIVKNTGGADQNINLQVQTNLNYGVNTSTTVPDPKKKGQEMAWVAQTGAGASVVEVFAGRNAKVAPSINSPQGNSFVQATFQLTVPRGKEVALLHMHGSAATQDAGVAMVNDINDTQLLRSLPREIRKLIVNFRGGDGFIGDVEILRGDILDVVELKSGDQFKGTLQEKGYSLETFYGPVEMPPDRVIGLVNIGRFRPRHLVVTADGQIFGGTLKKDTVSLQLSSGQVTQIPLSQVSRVGYRKREGEAEEWTFEKPIVLMRTGERVGVKMPAGPIEVVTRYGTLRLPPASVASVSFQSEDHGVHEIQLVDGSKFTGLLSADQFTMTLDVPGGGGGGRPAPAPAAGNNNAGGGGGDAAPAADQSVKFPATSIARLQLTNKLTEPEDDTATIELANDDVLVGTLTGKLKLDTAFDTIEVNTGEIKTLTHPTPGGLDVTVALWDGTTLSGQLQAQSIPAQLAAGVQMDVPVALLSRYEQPQPQPSAQMEEQIKQVITRLNADDWKERDRAEAQLVNMGPVAIGTLKKLRANQPPEAQQRIDSILKELAKQRDAQNRGGNAGARGNNAGPQTRPAGAIFDDALIER